MTKKNKVLQTSLVFIGVLLILGTYFLYPAIKKNTFKKDLVQKQMNNKSKIDSNEEKTIEGNIFENIEYKGIYNLNKEFTVKSKKAFVFDEKPDIVHMKNMKVVLYMDDGRKITITSDEGTYNKVTYDSYFVNNVKATDGKIEIKSNNLDLIATEDFASAYNDVFFTDDKSTLRADKVDYDFTTKNYYISMFNNKKIKIKLIQ